ncbi:NAD dependent epimerase/dehydratase family protein [Chitinophaga terrae (ex Kim and Jung 2007)]|uniref:NAD dependent epimerase/dehydratase family protein n=1 Tax=Chitinophaga terrae (ex Kim and Jung 2007) TaxID=408074 RepID=A0A1H4D1W7_9BACT|nr:NAD-dependent epimerase/dehydratase family protein [Chitinophaga terrae (ex Kim and Jung 2007)]GEP90602.1 epimerase [Chitinophaga terrae (ex Kim and Jung 2007)]SEA66745.1 NAD dependent epimerase/dehydratase family protein [Chitinophaga terrae (ex Kim and Jung 2007)]
MKLNVIITGATGMVGEGVLQECIKNEQVGKILLVNRKPSGVSDPKVTELLHRDFNDISSVIDKLTGYDACYFCAGVSSIGLKEEAYYALTYTLTLNFAKQLAAANPGMTFCYVSGAGTDSTEKGRLMWARVKGKTENALVKLPFKAVYNFRPAFMKPTKGAKNVKGGYTLLAAIYPIVKLLAPRYVLTLEQVGKAMINVSVSGYHSTTVEVKDIAVLATR